MNRRLFEIKGANHGLVQVVGSFAPAGTGAPTSVKGAGFTVARTGVGTFLVTLADKVPDIHGVSVTAQGVTAGLFTVDVGAITSGTSTATVVLRTLVSGAAADVAANAFNRVNFTITVKDSVLKP